MLIERACEPNVKSWMRGVRTVQDADPRVLLISMMYSLFPLGWQHSVEYI